MKKFLIENLSHPQKVRILYKTILRLHRGMHGTIVKLNNDVELIIGLPEELRDLGDKYVRDEFRRHLKCSPMEAQLFMTEWAKYAVTITNQLGLRGKAKGKLGAEIDEQVVEMLTDDQAVQLYELMLVAKGESESAEGASK